MNRKLLTSGSIALALILSPIAALAAESATKPATPSRIAFGEEVRIEDHVVAGKTTIFDFTSKYCPPCERISPMLDKLHADRADVVIVKVDINRADVKGIDWKSPVAQQYGLRFVPQFKVYGPDGKLQVEGEEASAFVQQMIGPDTE
jgi:thiol-disulfide isomerase/thioredoxin